MTPALEAALREFLAAHTARTAFLGAVTLENLTGDHFHQAEPINRRYKQAQAALIAVLQGAVILP